MTLPAVGTRIGQFEILHEIGRGGMGVVYAAYDSRLDRRVALKAIRAEYVGSQTVRVRFCREARAASRLAHPFVCQVFDLLDHNGDELIVMELLEGESLADRLARGPLALDQAFEVAIAAAEALAEAHRHGILHRDVKPSNLFLTRSGHLKVLDFGIAAIRGEPDRPGVNWSTGFRAPASAPGLGTPGYIAPEQLLGEPLDRRADIFSLGAVVFEMVTGRPAFSAAGVFPYLREVLQSRPTSLGDLTPDAPVPLDRLVTDMLSADPADRPDSMETVLRRLRQSRSAVAGAAAAGGSAPGSVPLTRYVRSGSVNVAYQVLGSGPVDLVYVPGWITHLEYGWEEPRVAGFLRRLASVGRVITFDKRGTGLSDRIPEFPTLDDRMDDVRAVMDAVGSERAIILGMSEGGNMSALFAASYPERTLGLITFGIFAKRVWAPDYPWAPTPDMREQWYHSLQAGWGGPLDVKALAPSLADDSGFTNWWAGYLRLGASPGSAVALARFNTQIDVRGVLPSIRVPTCVIHRIGDRDVSIEEARYIAGQIPGAELVALPGDDHLIYAGDQDALFGAIERFVARLVPTPLVTARFAAAVAFRGDVDEEHRQIVCPAAAVGLENAEVVREEPDLLGLRFRGASQALRFAARAVEAAAAQGCELRAAVHAGDWNLAGIGADPLAQAIELLDRSDGVPLVATGIVRSLVPGLELGSAVPVHWLD